MKINKILKTIILLGLGSSMLVACGGDDSDANTIKIGGSFDVTGATAQYGIPANKGALLAVKEYNEAGGVLGKQIEYIFEDNKGVQTDAASAYKKLSDSKDVIGFIGADISGTTETIANLAKEDGIPMISPSATKKEITSIAPNIFRACYIDPTQGEILANFADTSLNAKTAAVMINNESDYSVGIAEAFIEQVEALGIDVVAQVNYTAADVDFKSILAPVANANPDVILIPDYYEAVAKIAPQAREIGISGTFLGGDGWDGVTAMVGTNAEPINGSYFINHYTTEDDSPIVQDFIANYTEEYGTTPNAFAALGYDAACILLEGFARAETTDSSAVVNAIQNIDIEAVTGHITFDENRNPQKSVTVIEIVDGQNKLLEKFNPTTN